MSLTKRLRVLAMAIPLFGTFAVSTPAHALPITLLERDFSTVVTFTPGMVKHLVRGMDRDRRRARSRNHHRGHRRHV